MPEFPSRHRPLASRSDLTSIERAGVRKSIVIALAAFVGIFAVITTLVVISPTQTETIALLGP